MIRYRWSLWLRPLATVAAFGAITGFTSQTRVHPRVATLSDSSSGRSVLEGVYSAEQAARGDALYKSQCASCHGSDMHVGDTGPALAGPKFIENWRGQTLNDLADRIVTTMPPDDPGTLQKQQVSDLIASILNANKYPAGTAPLDSNSAALRHIRVDPPAP